MKKFKLFINGNWVDGCSGSYIDIENPATEEIFAQVPDGNAEDVNKAVAAARAAFQFWKKTSGPQRADYLETIADYIEDHKKEIGETITEELGAPTSMVIGWHVEGAICEARFFAKCAREFNYEIEKPGVIIRREPIGVVAGLTPWNYPLDQVSVKLLPALAAGNCVVLKPSQQAPLAAYWFTKATKAAGLPAGVFNLVTGRGGNVGNVLAAHPDVSMVSFTGSTKAGKEVGSLGITSNVKKIALELGGKSAAVLLESGNIETAVNAVLTKCFMNTGQTCSALTRFLVPRSRKNEVEALMKETAKKFTAGDPTKQETVLGPLVNASAYGKVLNYIRQGVEEGATLLTGSIPQKTGKGYFVNPVIFTDCTMDMKIASEEIFGPVLTVFYYDTKDEALAIANNSEYGLSGACIGKEEEAREFARNMETGVIHLNGAPFTVEAPFGGFKQSGLGRENSAFSFDEYLEIKAMLTNVSK